MVHAYPIVAEKSSRPALALSLLLGINLFNYIDRYVLAAVEPEIRHTFFHAGDASAMAKTGSLATAFLVSYMLLAPIFGFLADRFSRWVIIGASVAVWSLASGASGMAATFALLVATRVFVGIGEAGYGPAAPTIIADLFPVERRGRMLSYFYLAIPVGSALGYVLGGLIGSKFGWRSAFYAVVTPGLILSALCFSLRDPRQKAAGERQQKAAGIDGVFELLKIRSYMLNTAAMTAMTFAIGGMAFWIPSYIVENRAWELLTPAQHVLSAINQVSGSISALTLAANGMAFGIPSQLFAVHAADHAIAPGLLGTVNTTFGGITVIGGLLATLLGGWAGDRLRPRFPSSYFSVSAIGMLLAFPATIGMLFIPFPMAWVCIFFAIFFLFFNTGPSNTALANVSPAGVRATAFAMNILIIHLLGDALSPPLIGWIAGRTNMNTAFMVVSAMMVVASVFWFYGGQFLQADTERASAEASESTTEGAGIKPPALPAGTADNNGTTVP